LPKVPIVRHTLLATHIGEGNISARKVVIFVEQKSLPNFLSI